jgi:uroporphyrin-III C-methyltransferase/precorrin-2 dehydrogenase/sirohydrochlorin ferrochelatase
VSYPVTLQLQGRPCTVLGGGTLAVEKARGLVGAGARVTVIAATPDPALEALEAGGAIRLVRRGHAPGDLAGSFLAIDASGDEATNRRSFAEAEERGVLINVVDRPERCHFHAPALVRRGPLNLAISTGGESPFLAGALRARLERIVGEEWGPFTAMVGGVRRRLRQRGVPIAEQNRVYRRLLRSEVRDLLREGREADARYAAAAIETAAGQPRPGRVALVGAGPGDPGLLTVAARELLAEADAVYHDALVDPRTLALCGPHTRLIAAGKRGGRASADQAWITARLIEAARAGEDVVRLKGGDPFVFGRGGEELAALRRAGLEVIVVPGVSAALAAPAAAGIPVTLRGLASSLAIVTGSDRDGSSPAWLERIASAVDTLVVLMPLGNLERVCARLAAAVGPDRPAALVASATLPDQEVLRAPIARLARVAQEAGIASPATLVVGEVVTAMPAREVGELVAGATGGSGGGASVAGAGVFAGIQEVRG